MSIQVRSYLTQDCQAIANIYNEAIAKGGITMDCEPYPAAKIVDLVDKLGDRETILVAEIEGDVVGWGIIKKYSDRPGYNLCCETSIYLKSSATKKGYGRILQSALLEQVKAFDYHHFVAKIVASNQNSIKFHEKFGFEIIGVQKEIGFYRGRWYDMAIMQLLLGNKS